MDELIILTSIALRLAGVAYSLVLLYRVQDARFGFLTVMLTLMTARQVWTLGSGATGLEELPGLVVSVFALLTVIYLARYVEQERQITQTIRKKNARLRTFRKAIEHAGHAIFLTDTDGTITYANRAVESVTGYSRGEVLGENPSLWKSGRHDDVFYRDMWETILSGDVWEGQIVNERKDGSTSWVDMTIAPIVDDDGTVEQFVAVDTDITDRRQRKEKITEQNERLGALNHTNEVIRDVNQKLVEADSREAIEAAICREFAESPQYEFAWVTAQSATSDSFRVRDGAGIDAKAARRVQDEMVDPDAIQTAIDDRRVQLSDHQSEAAMRPDGGPAVESIAIVPLHYSETRYGALCIGTSDRSTFENIDHDVFTELGETIGYAINAIESKEALLTDSVTEIEFGTHDTDCFSVAMSRDLGCSLELEWIAPQRGETMVEYFTVTGTDPDAVIAYASDEPDLVDATMVAGDESRALFRFDVGSSCIARTLPEFGADLQSIAVREGQARVRAHLSNTGDVRALLEALQADHPDVELLARREVDRSEQTLQKTRSTLHDKLTDRQQEVLQTAYMGGFFEWPRNKSGEEIAEVMGIAQSTFLQHLRIAQRKVLSQLLDTES